MTLATTKRPKATIVKKASLAQAGSFLDDLPEKPKESLSLRQAVDQLRTPLLAALGKGYSYEELAKFLTDKGIEISPATLKNYLPSGRRQSSKAKEEAAPVKTRAKRTKRTSDTEPTAKKADLAVASKSIEAPAKATISVVDSSSETPTKPKRGRAKGTVAKAKAEETQSTPARRTRRSTKDVPPPPKATRRISPTRGRKKAGT